MVQAALSFSENDIDNPADSTKINRICGTFKKLNESRIEMNREEILAMEKERLLDLVQEKFNVRIKNLQDIESLSIAWEIVEKLEKRGWTIDIRSSESMKRVDGYKFIKGGGPGTIFAQHYEFPNFRSVTEGICKTSLIALELEGDKDKF